MLSVRLEAGRMVATIPSGGRPREYEVTPTRRELAAWSADIREVGGRKAYGVALWPGGSWTCDCPHTRYRGARCKHQVAGLEIAAFMGIDEAKRQLEAIMAKAKEQEISPAERIRRQLRNPFPVGEVKWKPQTVKGEWALVVAYIDARAVMDRLDGVLGLDGWRESYTVHADGSVCCRLEIRIGGEWTPREDVGGQSEQSGEHDRVKAAFSDALKRAAVKFGVGRYLYHLPKQWCEYDPAKRQFKRTPTLPAWAHPDTTLDLPPIPEPEPEPEPETPPVQTPPRPAQSPQVPQQPQPKQAKSLWGHAQDRDAAFVAEGLCQPGELTDYLREQLGPKLGANPHQWAGDMAAAQIRTAVVCFRQLAEEHAAAGSGAA